MAIRKIKINGDSVLRKKCRMVNELNSRNEILIEDMINTMYNSEGVGLAAPQVGILKRIVVVDITDVYNDMDEKEKIENKNPGLIVLINPEITFKEGEKTAVEGCLSVPGKQGMVKRPYHIKVKAKDKNFNDIELEAKDFFARAICHELDHLDGILYIDKLEEVDE